MAIVNKGPLKVNDKSSKEKPLIVVPGAGAAGFSAAKALSAEGYKVLLVEKNTLASGSSGRNPGRMGLGFHYPDAKTAIQYLKASVQVQRKYPGFLIRENEENTHPVRRGRYFITKDSNPSKEDILKTYAQIRVAYQELINEDPANEVFGKPEDLYRILSPSEYENDVNMDIVELGIETAEQLFDWKKFRHFMRKEIEEDENIIFMEHTEVVKIARGSVDQQRYLLHLKKDGGEFETIETDYIVNSTWENIEKLNDDLSLSMLEGTRTNRLKSLILVELPPDKINQDLPSMFFCMGQHAMFSNLGNGTGMITYAHATNIDTFQGIEVSDAARRILDGKATEEDIKLYGKEVLDGTQILAGAQNYIPALAHAKIKEVFFGIVQTAGSLSLADLDNPNSSHHKRDYYGVGECEQGVIKNSAVKLFHFPKNGELVVELIRTQEAAQALIDERVFELASSALEATLPINKDIKKALRGHLERNTTAEEFLSVQAYEKTLNNATKIDDESINKYVYELLALVEENSSADEGSEVELADLIDKKSIEKPDVPVDKSSVEDFEKKGLLNKIISYIDEKSVEEYYLPVKDKSTLSSQVSLLRDDANKALLEAMKAKSQLNKELISALKNNGFFKRSTNTEIIAGNRVLPSLQENPSAGGKSRL